jgi:hypothetical protein
MNRNHVVWGVIERDSEEYGEELSQATVPGGWLWRIRVLALTEISSGKKEWRWVTRALTFQPKVEEITVLKGKLAQYEDNNSPNFDYDKVEAYAKKMGLPTKFPL